jgi:hypothetical protein
MWTNLLCISHNHILVHLSCHSITKTKQGPFSNADHAERHRLEAEEEEHGRGPRPRDLANAFDRVGERQVFKTPSANMAVAMANLDRLPDQPEIQQVHDDIRAHLITSMGQTIELAKRAQITLSCSVR